MTEKRFTAISEEMEGKFSKCPKCGSRDLSTDIEWDNDCWFKLGPNWRRCIDCGNLFIKNEEEENA
jgi:hypothetical protein